MKALVLLVFLSVYISNASKVFAQDTIQTSQRLHSRGVSLGLGVLGSSFSVRDMETSPLMYHGLLPGAQLNACYDGKKIAAMLNFSFSYGKLITRNYVEGDKKAAAYNSYLDVAVARKINLTGSSLFIGPQLALIVNFRRNDKFDNANVNYEGFAMLGPVVAWEKQLVLRPQAHKRDMKISASLFVPVINEVSRPPYNSVGDFVDGLDRVFHANLLKLTSFNQFTAIVSTLSSTYYWQNRNAVKLSYRWYYYNYYPAANKVSGVQSNISLSFMIRIGKK